MPSHVYSGPTDPYGPPNSTFPGPHVQAAPVLAVTVRPVGPPQGPKRPATCVLVANPTARGPRILCATVDTPASAWAVHPQGPTLAGKGTQRVQVALAAVGIPARPAADGTAAIDVRIATRTGVRTLRLSVDNARAYWYLIGTHAGGTWPVAQPQDLAARVLRWLVVAKAQPLP